MHAPYAAARGKLAFKAGGREERVDLRDKFGPVWEQGELNSCACCATVSAVEAPTKGDDPSAEARHNELLQLVADLVRRHPGLPGARAAASRLERRRSDVLIAIAELLELHDRARVEVFAFSWSPQDGSAMPPPQSAPGRCAATSSCPG